MPEITVAGRIFSPRPLPTVLTALMLVVLISLGVWQLQRAAWKADLIAQWEAKQAEAPLDILPPAEQSKDITFRKAKLLGKFQHEKSVQITPRVLGTQIGAELITPLKMMTGEMVLVDRGFVATDTHAAIDQPIGTVFVEGLLAPMPAKGAMQPANNVAKDQWYWLDAQGIATAKQLGTLYPLHLIAQGPPLKNAWPKPADITQPYSNNHMVYAFIWFSLALALGVVYFISQSHCHPREGGGLR